MSFQPPMPGLGVLSTHQDINHGIVRSVLNPAAMVDQLRLPFVLRAPVSNAYRYTACELAYLRWFAVSEVIGEAKAEAVRQMLLTGGQVALIVPANGLKFQLPLGLNRLLGDQDCEDLAAALRDQVFVVPASRWCESIVEAIEAGEVVQRLRGREVRPGSYRDQIERDALALAERMSR